MNLKRELAPSGNRVHALDLLSCLNNSRSASIEALKHSLKLLVGHDQAFLFSTGRAAMTALLTSMADVAADKNRRFVVIPSYTCYSVPASVARAGLSVMVCDVDPQTLDYDRSQLESLDWSTVLAVVSSNLFGIPNDLAYLERIAHLNGAFMIDDAAQCLGATESGRAVGSYGDAGILSFDKGKVVTSVNGGVIVTNSPTLSDRLAENYSVIPNRPRISRLLEIAKLITYAIFINPALYWIPERLPFLKLGHTVYDDSFPIERYVDRLAPVVLAQLCRIDTLNRDRKKIAARYDFEIPELGAVSHIRVSEGADPIYLRYPVRITDASFRRDFLKSYRQFGCRAFYPSCIADIPQIREKLIVHNDSCEAGRAVANQLVTLPTHQFVTDRDIQAICFGLAKFRGTQGTRRRDYIV